MTSNSDYLASLQDNVKSDATVQTARETVGDHATKDIKTSVKGSECLICYFVRWSIKYSNVISLF